MAATNFDASTATPSAPAAVPGSNRVAVAQPSGGWVVVTLDNLLAAARAGIVAATLTGDVSDYAPGAARFLALTATVPCAVKGLDLGQLAAGGVWEAEIWNAGVNPITLRHQVLSNKPTNRFLGTRGADLTLQANETAMVRYDFSAQRWRVRKG